MRRGFRVDNEGFRAEGQPKVYQQQTAPRARELLHHPHVAV